MDFFQDNAPKRSVRSLAGHYDSVASNFLATLWRRRMLIGASGAGAMALAALALLYIPQKYSAELLLQFDFGREEAKAAGRSTGVTLEPSSLVESEARIIRSPATAQVVVTTLGLDTEPVKAERSFSEIVGAAANTILPATLVTSVRDVLGIRSSATEPSRRDLLAVSLMKSLKVTNDAKAYLISLQFTDRSPQRAANIVNAFGAEYMRRKLDAAGSAAQRSSQWFAGQVREARAELDRIEASVAAFRQKTGFVELTTDGADVQQQLLRDMLVQLNNASATRLAEEARLRRVKEVVAGGGIPSATDLGGSPVIQLILDEESKTRKAMEELVVVAGEKHPMVQRQLASLAALQERVKKQVAQAVANIETDVAASRANERALSAQAAVLQQKSIDAKATEGQLKSLQADATAARERLRSVTDSYQQANALSELKPVMAQILGPAEVPTLPSSPNPPLVLGLALFGGLGLGAALSYLLEKRERGFRGEDEVVTETTTTCVGLLPTLGRYPSALDGLVFSEAVRSAVAELFPATNPPKVVLVTSAVPGEGKSFVASAMARLLTMMGRRVLVIDGSPRRLLLGGKVAHEAILDQCLTLDGSRGADESGVATVRRASGLKGGQNVYSDPAFDSMMREARERYDVILFEIAPVMLSADSALVRDHADSVIHVVKWDDTNKTTVNLALERLSRLGLDVGGVILNEVDLAEQARYGSMDRGKIYRDYNSFYQTSA